MPTISAEKSNAATCAPRSSAANATNPGPVATSSTLCTHRTVSGREQGLARVCVCACMCARARVRAGGVRGGRHRLSGPTLACVSIGSIDCLVSPPNPSA